MYTYSQGSYYTHSERTWSIKFEPFCKAVDYDTPKAIVICYMYMEYNQFILEF